MTSLNVWRPCYKLPRSHLQLRPLTLSRLRPRTTSDSRFSSTGSSWVLTTQPGKGGKLEVARSNLGGGILTSFRGGSLCKEPTCRSFQKAASLLCVVVGAAGTGHLPRHVHRLACDACLEEQPSCGRSKSQEKQAQELQRGPQGVSRTTECDPQIS